MMRRYVYYILIVAFTVGLASCSSSRKASSLPDVGGLSGTAYLEQLITKNSEWDDFSAKTSLELFLGKKGSTRVNASVKIRRGEVIQLSIAPLLGIEVARLELTPEGLLLVDRVHKRFVRTSFAQVSQLLHVDLNFHIIQSLFLNEIFLPTKTDLGLNDVSSFTLKLTSSRVVIQPKGRRKVSYQFHTSPQTGLLKQTLIGLRGTGYSLNWDYDEFTNLEGRRFPKKTLVSFKGLDDTYAMNFKLSRLSVGGNWKSRTTLSSRYKEMKLQEILKELLK